MQLFQLLLKQLKFLKKTLIELLNIYVEILIQLKLLMVFQA